MRQRKIGGDGKIAGYMEKEKIRVQCSDGCVPAEDCGPVGGLWSEPPW